MNGKTNGKTNDEVEVQDAELETAPEAGGLVVQKKDDANQIIQTAKIINQLIDAQNQIRLAVLRLAQPGDWILFKSDSEKNGKAELGFAGAMRIASTLGVSFVNWQPTKETGVDKKGDWYRWEYECDAVYGNRIVRVYGRAGSRDKFFGKAKGELRPIEDIDEGNIKMAGRRAAMKEGTKVIFGLHHLDPEFLNKNGVSLVSAGGYTFSSHVTTDKPAGTISETQQKRLFAILQNGAESQVEKDARSQLLHEYMMKEAGVEHSKEVNWKDYEKVCKKAEEIATNRK